MRVRVRLIRKTLALYFYVRFRGHSAARARAQKATWALETETNWKCQRGGKKSKDL